MSAPLRLCLLALLPLFATSCGRKADPAEAAKTFFGLIANGRSSEAYESTALAFKAQQSEKGFAQTNKELGLVNVLSLTNTPPEIEGKTATLQMEVTDREGAKSPLTVTLVDERGAWRVFSVRAPRSLETGISANLFGVVGRGRGFTDGVSHPMPTDREIRQLVESTLLLFNECVQAGSFVRLYEEISTAWKEQGLIGSQGQQQFDASGAPIPVVTEAKFRRAFQGFIEKKISIAHIQGQPAIFYEPPAISTDGHLTARGYYAGDQTNVVFGMKFTYETPKWRLFGLDVSLAKALEP